MSVETEEEQNRGHWAGRPGVAWAIKLVAWVTPIAVSAIACYFIAQAFPRPRALLPAIIWFVGLSVVATGILFAVDKLARRLLPLAALFNLSLVFPDRAPSRFKSALRTSTVHQLSERVAEIKRTGLPDDPALAAETLIELVAALSAHDRLTRGHAERVRAYSRMIGEELKLDADDLDKLQWAGLLHDVGKLFVPGEILNKPSRLTDEEFDVIKKHPGWGAQLCEPLRDWLGDWVDAVGEHHERWDGKGYPNGIAGDDISLAARIVSVADVYDVITSVRSYKSATSAVEARQELARCAGTQFDAHIVRAFLNISLGRLRLAMGPLSWIAQLPIIGRVPIGATASTAGTAAGVAATGAALLATGALGQPLPEDVYVPTVEAQAIEEPVETVPLVTTPTPTTVADSAPVTVEVPPATAPPTTAAPTTAPPTTAPPTTAPPTTAPPTTAAPAPGTPVAADDRVTIDEGSFADIDVAANDANVASITVTEQPGVGVVTVHGGTVLRYTPPTDWAGTTSFTYRIDNGAGSSDTATVSITVSPVPDPPVAIADTAATDEDVAVVISPLGNDTDVDGDPLSISGASSTDGTATTDGTTITYTPAPDTFGTQTVTYTIADGTGLTASTSILVAVTARPDDPLAVPDAAATDEDVGVVINPLGNDTDPDGDAVSITGASSTDGTVTTDGTTITYTPAPDSNGAHSVTYTIGDGTGRTDSTTITVTVTATPDAPVAADDTATTDEDVAVAISPLDNDTDPDGDPLTITGASSTDGTATTDGTTITYTPAPDSNGTHTVAYTIDDGTGRTDTAGITVTVNPTPDTPVANDDTATVDEDATVTAITVLANDTDPTGDPLTIVAVSSSDGTATTDGTTIDYTPAPDTFGTHTIAYTIDDGTGRTDDAVVTVTVDPTPDAPVAGDDTASVDEDATVAGLAVLGNDTDVDGDPLTITGVSSTDGTPTTDGTTIDYTPAPDSNGIQTITYTIADGTGRTDTATVTVTVDPTPDAPVANDDTATVDEDGTVNVVVLLDDTDADGDPLTVVSATSADGAATTDGAVVTYTPAPDAHGTHTVTYTVDDGTGRTDTATVTVTVSPQPDDPIAVDDNTSVNEDGSIAALTVLVNDTDADGDPLTITGAASTDGTATTDGVTIGYTPAPDAFGTHTVTYTIDDGTGRTDTATVTVTVVPLPDDPVANDDTAWVLQDGSVDIDVLGNDVDVDLDPLTVTTASSPDGVATTDGTTIDYTPAAGTFGTHTVSYGIDDGTGRTDTATVTVTVDPVPDTTDPTITASVAPVANGDGWHNSTVTVTFVCDDPGPGASGVASCTDPVTVATEGTGQVVVGNAADWAGNTATTSVSLDVDLTPPEVTILGVDDGDVLPAVPAVSCTATDALSGVDGPCTATVIPGAPGEYSVGATATDFAGNTTTETIYFKVPVDCPSAPPFTPCTIPAGTVWDGDLWIFADVWIYGEVTGYAWVVGGDVTVGPTGIVGDVYQNAGGSVTVEAGGSVRGVVIETGSGSVVVDGTVDGDVTEGGAGDVTVGAAGSVGGRVEETGDGSVTVDGSVTEDVEEQDEGDLDIGATATLSARAEESGDGSVFVEGDVADRVRESDAGNLVVLAGASLGDQAHERGVGNLVVDGPSYIALHANEDNDGDLTIGDFSVVDGNADSSGPGSCTISPLATVNGELRGDC